LEGKKKKTVERKKESWSCPTEGTIKINVDATFDVDQGKGSLAAVARDFKGKFLYASCKELLFVADPFMAEAYALREGLSMAQHLGVNKVVIQSDNLQVIETMNNGGFWATTSAAIFEDCVILAAGYRNISFDHCNREANEVAYELARYSFHDHVDQIWDSDPPSCLLPKLINDVTIFEKQ
jgi:ribonuclease HI